MTDKIGYCTNVHPGRTLQEVKDNLEKYAVPVRDSLGSQLPLPVGLWLSKTTAAELATSGDQIEFARWLADRKLEPYTFNGFPFGDFHQDVVKHDVYCPTWADQERLRYTKHLAEIQSRFLEGKSDEATISTLPLGWPTDDVGDPFFEECGRNLVELALFLEALHRRSGMAVRVCLEPEPGCVLDTASDITWFFDKYLHSSDAADAVRGYLGVCHDVCHSAVMFEPQELAVQSYVDAGIVVGKVQVSSAVEANFDFFDDSGKRELLDSLSEFAEHRYLHQTTIERDGNLSFFEDLSVALGSETVPNGKWRVHFHVPIFQDAIGRLSTTQTDIVSLVDALRRHKQNPQWEIETYAWSVLPEEFQNEPLAQSISREIEWFGEVVECR